MIYDLKAVDVCMTKIESITTKKKDSYDKRWIEKREGRSPEKSKSFYILGITLNYTLF